MTRRAPRPGTHQAAAPRGRAGLVASVLGLAMVVAGLLALFDSLPGEFAAGPILWTALASGLPLFVGFWAGLVARRRSNADRWAMLLGGVGLVLYVVFLSVGFARAMAAAAGGF